MQIQEYPNAVYKGFEITQDALEWLARFSSSPEIDEFKSQLQSEESKNQNAIMTVPETRDEGKVIIYSDGACSANPGPGGYGVIMIYKKHYRELSGGYNLTTSNRMEIMGCIAGLSALKYPSNVIIYSDSEYVIRTMKLNKLKKWANQSFFRKRGGTGSKC